MPMKLYVLNCGRMITPDGNVLSQMNTDRLKLVIPVPAYLLVHPVEGLVLIDTGFAYERLPEAMRGDVAWSPLMGLRRRIASLGYDPDQVRHVLISHLHFDHAGQMTDFPKALFHMRKSEWDAAIPPSRGDYFPDDYMRARDFAFSYMPENEDCDLFGDGSVIAIHTPGHSPGHSSFLLTLPNTGRILLTVDAAHLPEYFTDARLYADAKDIPGCRRSLERLAALRQTADLTVYGHDPAVFSRLRQAPDYYD